MAVVDFSFFVGLILALVWTGRRIYLRRRRRPLEGNGPGSTSPGEVGWAVAISVFLFPILILAALYLARGSLILFAFLLEPFPLPGLLGLGIWAILATSASFMAFSFTFFVIERIWPASGPEPDPASKPATPVPPQDHESAGS